MDGWMDEKDGWLYEMMMMDVEWNGSCCAKQTKCTEAA